MKYKTKYSTRAFEEIAKITKSDGYIRVTWLAKVLGCSAGTAYNYLKRAIEQKIVYKVGKLYFHLQTVFNDILSLTVFRNVLRIHRRVGMGILPRWRN